ncbi:MAG: hypothetical protein IKW46_08120 [Bacteroidaceae bacterium]|nr:hypothetical protein [Bacteroidaceae bacterium]
MDWNAVREEYIADESSSYRKLAKKYDVSVTAIYNRAKAEDWQGQRKQLKDKTVTKSIEKISDKKANQAAKYNDMVYTMTAKLTAAINAVDPKDTTAVRRLTASLCDLRELLGIKSEADSREQEARIANLRRQADKEDDTVNEIEIVFAAGPEEWNG